MTTIRRRRVRAPSPEPSTVTTSASASLTPRTAADEQPVRLVLVDSPTPQTLLDGAWWPRSTDLANELPPLVAELQRRGIRVIRGAYNPDAWEPCGRRLAADGRIIRLGWFRSLDRQLLNLTSGSERRRMDLLVVPPNTSPAAAERAFGAVVDVDSRRTATETLAGLAAGEPIPTPPVPRAAAVPGLSSTRAWDTAVRAPRPPLVGRPPGRCPRP